MVSSLVALSTTYSGVVTLPQSCKPGRDVELVPLVLGQVEIAEWRGSSGVAGGADQHLGQFGHALAVAAGVGGLGVDGAGDQLDEGIQQAPLGVDELLVVESHGGLRGQGLDQGCDGIGEGDDLVASLGSTGVEKLQHADDVAVVVLQGHGQEGLRAVAGPFVELLGAGKVEILGRVGVGDVDRRTPVRAAWVAMFLWFGAPVSGSIHVQAAETGFPCPWCRPWRCRGNPCA